MLFALCMVLQMDEGWLYGLKRYCRGFVKRAEERLPTAESRVKWRLRVIIANPLMNTRRIIISYSIVAIFS
jgi:hypothetical protein